MEKQTAKNRMFRTSVDIPQENREQLVNMLNQHLANTFDLMSQTKQAHWNVKGRDFYQLHELFDELAANLSGHVDAIAERATALGGTALGTARMAAESSQLDEYPIDITESMQHVECLAERYAATANGLREAIEQAEDLGDPVTADLFTGITQDVDKHLWFLEAHLQGGKR